MNNYDIFTIQDNNLQKISSSDLNKIAYLAATLKPKQSSIKVLGHYYALIEYMEQHHYSELYDSYKCLIGDINGRCILLSAMELSIMEYEHRQSKITPQTMALYNARQLQYQQVLDYNNQYCKKKIKKSNHR